MSNQTQTGINELLTGNRKDHIWVWKHKDEEEKVWQVYCVYIDVDFFIFKAV